MQRDLSSLVALGLRFEVVQLSKSFLFCPFRESVRVAFLKSDHWPFPKCLLERHVLLFLAPAVYKLQKIKQRIVDLLVLDCIHALDFSKN